MHADLPVDDALARLRRRCSGPHPPEPPRAHALVTLAATLAARRPSSSRRTPHLCGGADREKTQFEYDLARSFLENYEPWLPRAAMAGKAVLDLGCGWGGKAVYFAQHCQVERMEGFDLPGVFVPEVPLEFARTLGVSGCGFRTGYAEAIPYGGGEFDLILCEDVLEHVADPAQVLQESARVLRPGGSLLAVFPSFRMIDAHHLDRALTWPALHYVLSMKTWAAGLNQYLLDHEGESFEPFSEAVATRFHPCALRDLNGMGFRQFAEVAAASPLATRELRLLPRPTPDNGRSVWLKRIYRALCRQPLFAEPLSQRVLYLAVKA